MTTVKPFITIRDNDIVVLREAFWPVSYFFRIRLIPICRTRTRTDVCYNDTIGMLIQVVKPTVS